MVLFAQLGGQLVAVLLCWAGSGCCQGQGRILLAGQSQLWHPEALPLDVFLPSHLRSLWLYFTGSWGGWVVTYEWPKKLDIWLLALI
jgi:hypothetical protein